MHMCSLRAQAVLSGVVAPCYQHGGVDNKVPQLHTTQSECLEYILAGVVCTLKMV